jgi:hypothetical protein
LQALRLSAYKASLEDDKQKLRWLDRHLANRELESINRALIDAITEAQRAEGCSNATVNRMLALVRATLRKCVRDWECSIARRQFGFSKSRRDASDS